MSDKIDIDQNVLNAVLLIFRKKKLHVRQIARDMGVSATTASTLLKKLHTGGVLELDVLGKNCFYSISPSFISKKLVSMAEMNRTLSLLSRNKELNVYLQGIFSKLSEIFSMIDCIILMKKDPPELLFVTRLEVAELRKITRGNPLACTRRELYENKIPLPEDYFVLHGAENFVDLRKI